MEKVASVLVFRLATRLDQMKDAGNEMDEGMRTNVYCTSKNLFRERVCFIEWRSPDTPFNVVYPPILILLRLHSHFLSLFVFFCSLFLSVLLETERCSFTVIIRLAFLIFLKKRRKKATRAPALESDSVAESSESAFPILSDMLEYNSFLSFLHSWRMFPTKLQWRFHFPSIERRP